MTQHRFTYRYFLILAALICLALAPDSVLALQGGEKLPGGLPDKTQFWVNDFAGVFNNSDKLKLEQKLRNFANRTSTQILVATVDDNGGYPASALAPRVAEQWEIGQQGKDNGLLILMDMQDRDVFIAPGYGLEEYVPDAIAKRIVENEVIPRFKQGDFYGGIDAATEVLISLLDGKFTADEYRSQTSGGGGAGIGGIIFMIILFSILFGGRSRRSTGVGRSNLPLWIALGMLSGGGRSHSGSWGGFSGGSGGFGGGGGGFGGFSGGGGGFGGGGAGGSW